MALGIFKKAWNTAQLNDLTNYFSLASYILKLNGENFASGTSTVNINGKSGVIGYGITINPEESIEVTFINTSIDNNSAIMFSLVRTSDSGNPYVQNYKIEGGSVIVTIANSSAENTVDGFNLNFLIVN
jgi:hypothetical protein